VTAFDFAEAGQRGAWIGAVAMAPGTATGGHHHGRHEVSVYVVAGHGLIRWGNTLEFGAEIGPGDFIYFAPHVPHEEVNLDPAEPLRFVVVRSDNERIVVPLDTAPVETPEMLV
jgi:uncharacterized RmlC-like cupin family protein